MSFPFNRVLVTGGAGFIGSHLTEALVAKGCRVTVLDNLTTGHMANLSTVKDRIEFVHGDIRDLGTLDRTTSGCEFIFHLAAVVSVPQTVEQPVDSAKVNDMGTLHVFEAARNSGAVGVVFASSSAVYGDDPELPKREDMLPKTLSPYAAQKMTGEYYAQVYTNLFGIKSTCLRFFNVYGPRQDPSSAYSGVISIFMAKTVSGTSPTIYGDGNQSRDFVFVGDVVRAILLAAASSAAAGGSVNIGSGRPVTVNNLWEMICRINGSTMPPLYAPSRPGDIYASVADIEKAKSQIGFSPETDFDRGLELTFQWYKKSVGGNAEV